MRRPLLVALWLLTDICVFLAVFAAAYVLRVGPILSTDFPFDQHMTAAIIVAPVWLSLLILTRTFSLLRQQRTPKNLAYIAYAALMGTSFFALSYYFLYGTFFSRLLLVYAFGLVAVFTWVWHLVCGYLLRIFLVQTPPTYPTLVIGTTREAAALIKHLRERQSPIQPVGILDGRGTKEKDIHGVPVLGKLNKLEDALAQHHITHLIQCSDLEQSINLLSACRARGITYLLLPSVLGIVEGDEQIEMLEGRPVAVVRPHQPWWMWFFS